MRFHSAMHLYNAYKKAIKENGFSFDGMELGLIEDVCRAVHKCSEELPGVIKDYFSLDEFQCLWNFLQYSDTNRDLLSKLGAYYGLVEDLTEGDGELTQKELIDRFLLGGNLEGVKTLRTISQNILTNLHTGRLKTRLMSDDALLEIFLELHGKSGIYFLYDEIGNLSYIGKSINLTSRILSSMRERRASGFKYMITPKTDVHFLEMYLISKMDPYLNTEGRTEAPTTFELDIPYTVSNLYQVFEMKKVGE